jgi:hypothetical protein
MVTFTVIFHQMAVAAMVTKALYYQHNQQYFPLSFAALDYCRLSVLLLITYLSSNPVRGIVDPFHTCQKRHGTS